ncbi:MAG: hypothetical protein WA919_25685 [Coleofasciculaceae cyanobacterium]
MASECLKGKNQPTSANYQQRADSQENTNFSLIMSIEIGQEFIEVNKGYRWKIEKPWFYEKLNKRIGWECIAVDRKMGQTEISKWFDEEVRNFLEKSKGLD